MIRLLYIDKVKFRRLLSKKVIFRTQFLSTEGQDVCYSDWSIQIEERTMHVIRDFGSVGFVAIIRINTNCYWADMDLGSRRTVEETGLAYMIWTGGTSVVYFFVWNFCINQQAPESKTDFSSINAIRPTLMCTWLWNETHWQNYIVKSSRTSWAGHLAWIEQSRQASVLYCSAVLGILPSLSTYVLYVLYRVFTCYTLTSFATLSLNDQ